MIMEEAVCGVAELLSEMTALALASVAPLVAAFPYTSCIAFEEAEDTGRGEDKLRPADEDEDDEGSDAGDDADRAEAATAAADMWPAIPMEPAADPEDMNGMDI